MRPRELAHLFGFGRRYFFSFWARDLQMYRAPLAVQDAAGALFVHIPKTAGVSVCHAIYGTDELFDHAPASGWQHFNPERFKRLFSFSLMREPADRFGSAFYYLRNVALTDKDNAFGRRVLAAFNTPDALLVAMARDRILRAKVMSWVHFTPQAWYLTDRAGQVIVDYIGRVETFDDSMDEIAARIGKSYTPIHSNASKRPKSLDLSPPARSMLERLYAEDFALYRAHMGKST